jgi:radical SAM peptide maturase (CXXX-repeat target family)
MWEDDEPDGFINKKTEFIVLDFIGGEPTLQIELMDKIITYFFNRAIVEVPKWAETFMISFASNGTTYFQPEVNKFLNKWRSRLSYCVSIDGPQQMHDACRVFPDGRGSFALAEAAQDDYNKSHYHSAGTKATISWENMPYLDTTLQYFIDKGYTRINANTIFEPDWTVEQAQFYYQKLKQVADMLLEKDMGIYISLFDEIFFQPKVDMEQTWCGGYDSMLAFDTEGNCFPCIRYMDSSLNGRAEPVIIGDAWNGLWKTEKQKCMHDCLACTTWRSQNDEECLNCPIAAGCSDCAAESYQHFGCFNKRHKLGSCWVHRARSLANVYY